MKIVSKDEDLRKVYMQFENNEIGQDEYAHQMKAILDKPYVFAEEGIHRSIEASRMGQLWADKVISDEELDSQLKLLDLAKIGLSKEQSD